MSNKIDWRKASELKEINYSICIKYDGGGAPCYETVSSMTELENLKGEIFDFDDAYYLYESEEDESAAKELLLQAKYQLEAIDNQFPTKGTKAVIQEIENFLK
jgi:intein/homing endonuclease